MCRATRDPRFNLHHSRHLRQQTSVTSSPVRQLVRLDLFIERSRRARLRRCLTCMAAISRNGAYLPNQAVRSCKKNPSCTRSITKTRTIQSVGRRGNWTLVRTSQRTPRSVPDSGTRLLWCIRRETCIDPCMPGTIQAKQDTHG